jgi:hypothetical protein
MKKILMSLIFGLCAVFAVNAASVLDTTNASLNAVDEGWWDPLCDSLSSIDTTGGFFKKDGTDDIVVLKCTKGAAIGDSIYPWVELDCELDSIPTLAGVTAIRVTYKADSAWYLILPDPTIDENNSAPYQALVPAATEWTTKYFNVLDTSFTYSTTATFTQPSWVTPSKYRSAIKYTNIKNLAFSPRDENDVGLTTTIQIKDVALFNYAGFKSSVKFAIAKAVHHTGSIQLTRTNALKFEVPVSGNYTVSLFSPAGKRIAIAQRSFTTNGTNELSLKNYNIVPGLYLISVSSENYSATAKLLIR